MTLEMVSDNRPIGGGIGLTLLRRQAI